MLINAALFAFRHARVVLPAAVLTAALALAAVQTYRASAATTRAETLSASLEAVRSDLASARARHAREITSITGAIEKERQTAEAERDALDAISSAAPDADGPVAPVLADTLRRLK